MFAVSTTESGIVLPVTSVRFPELPGVGHFIALERPDVTAGLLATAG